MNHLEKKVIVVTGAAGGFGRIVSEKAAARGAKLVCADINESELNTTVANITSGNGAATAKVTDVTDLAQMKALAAHAVEQFGRIDVMVNNAGVMPLAFYADHENAAEAWSRCIDINFKGVLNGISAVYDQMMAQGQGHVVNLSSIYGNFPVVGAGVYGATKAAVNFLSESLRVESHGKIKVTIVKPTGVPQTGLSGGVVNSEAVVGILGQNAATYGDTMMKVIMGEASAEQTDPDSAQYAVLNPDYLADQVIYAMDQPWGVSIGDVTVRATGDGYIL